ncbi:hypothetical protein AQI95_07045 [Streptomyces yokosukanensis]|uniref:Lipoprotein n=1 Tax=Streptomyces yokosukanensis TaxID=67386 RepID=A0A101PC42_9ACTN|nr:hypothetical protein [Streptomyces yokosukanensis]KUN08760.1 hypothetical protein AQI95_07045 [Streptomyces yokosukanensis]
MNRRPLLIVAALTSAAALSLSACSSGSKDKGSDKIAGAGGGDTKQSASPSPSATASADRPAISLPSDVKDDFENWEIGDATKDAVLTDAGGAQNAMNDAILKGDPNTSAMSFYYKDKALVSTVKWVQKWKDAGLTFTGTTSYFNPKVDLFGKNAAGVVFCSDETKAFNKNRKTGKVDHSAPGKDAFVLYNMRLEKNAQGVWQTAEGTSVRGSQSCMR